ncbi:MAG: energy transducer TonB family protein [Limisphaerales bacterium]
MTASSPPEPADAWDRTRILVATALLAAIQGILFVSLSRWPTLPEPRRGEPFTVRLAPQPRDTRGTWDWSADPRQFSSNHRDGLVSRDPASPNTPEYPLFRWEQAPQWLGASSGTLSRPGPDRVPARERPAGLEVSGPIPSPTIRPPLLKGETSFSLRGELAPLALEAVQAPPSSQVDDILPSTVIELVVGPGGDVIRARLAVGCGNADADRAALSWARGLRFVATAVQSGPGATDPTQWKTGDLVIHWNTRPVPQR